MGNGVKGNSAKILSYHLPLSFLGFSILSNE